MHLRSNNDSTWFISPGLPPVTVHRYLEVRLSACLRGPDTDPKPRHVSEAVKTHIATSSPYLQVEIPVLGISLLTDQTDVKLTHT